MPSALVGPIERGNRVMFKVWLVPEVPSARGVGTGTVELSPGDSNRKGMFWASALFSALRPASLTLGPLIRVMVWATGWAGSGEVMKLPNCRPILAAAEITVGPVASTTGVPVALSWVMVRPSVPPLTVKLRTLAEPVCWVLAIKSWALLSTWMSTPPGAERITLLT